MNEVQRTPLNIQKNKVNTHTKQKYSNLSAINSALMPIITKHGLLVRFKSTEDSEKDICTVRLVVSHIGGFSDESSKSAPLDTGGSKNALQAMGSTITYLQRYLLCLYFNISSDDDDDGNSGRGRTVSRKEDGLTEKQVKAIKGHLSSENCKISEEAILGGYQVASLGQIPANNFARIMGRLAMASSSEAQHA